MNKVTIFEMAPRDGLQNEPRMIATADKVKLVDLLSVTGLKKIETASFVSPKWVPQMADGAQVLASIKRVNGVAYTSLTPNQQGLEKALAANVSEVAVFASASEGFSRANINCAISESLDRFRHMIPAIKKAGVPLRAYVSCVTDCPYDGQIAPAQVAHVAQALIDMGAYQVSLGDTIGTGTPESVDAMLVELLQSIPASQLAGHYHDTRGRALDNIRVSLKRGLRTFDAAVGGLGGCPYAGNAPGNVATEKVVALVEDLGFATGVDRLALAQAADFAKVLREIAI